MELQKYKKLNSNVLKLIAIVAMTIDHTAWKLFPGYSTHPVAIIMHLIGRLTCPIMCYFIAEGFHYTRDVNKYTARLFIFALISHVPYMLWSMSYSDITSLIPFYNGQFFNYASVIWSLAWGLVLLRVSMSEKLKQWQKVLIALVICFVSFPADWSCIAALCVCAIGSNRGEPRKQIAWCMLYLLMYVVVYFFALDKLYAFLQLGVVLSIPLLALYNGKRGTNPTVNKVVKWLFYIYYPLHFVVLVLIFGI